MDNNNQPPKELQQLVERNKQRQIRVQQDSLVMDKAEDLTEKLWPLMAAMYGYKFMSQFGESPDSTWAKCLKGITGQQMATALEASLNEYPVWPPGAAQFRAMCLGLSLDEDGKECGARAGMYDTRPTDYMKTKLALPKDPSKTNEAHDKAMDAMRGMFDDDPKPEAVEAKLCTKCVQEYNPALNECPNCQTGRN